MSTSIEERICPVCGRLFDTVSGRNKHLHTAKSCRGHHSGKLKALAEAQFTALPPPSPSHTALPPKPAEDVGAAAAQISAQQDDDLYYFVAEPEPAIGEEGPGPSTLAAHRSRIARAAQERVLDDYDDTRVRVVDETAGRAIRVDPSMHDLWRRMFGTEAVVGMDAESTQYLPFASELDWRIASWAVKEDVSQGAFNRLLAIPGVCERLQLSFKNTRGLHKRLDRIEKRAGDWHTEVMQFPDTPDERHTIYFREPLEAIKSLWGDPTLAQHLVYRPEKVFSDATRADRLYSEMWTGKWWTTIQSKLPDGATLAPVIVASDKTQLTNFSGGISAYPVYLTLGNLPKAIRRKPGMHACVLIAYLPTSKVTSHTISVQEARNRQARLFHESMRHVFGSLINAGRDGVEMAGGDGVVRHVHPVLAAYVADYPEQCLVTCSKSGTCPKCQCPSDKLQDPQPADPRTNDWTRGVMESAKIGARSAAQYSTRCMESDVLGGVYKPFWDGMPYTDIHVAITPDVLHQLYQGVFKHLVSWCKLCLSAEELDRRVRTLPPAFGVRHFDNGISALSQVTGKDRKHMARILLGCLVGLMPRAGIVACKAILDFIYYAQYTTHDDVSLAQMRDSLHLWHENSHHFITTHCREDFNIPKFHSLLHYVDSIPLLGTTDNFNTELFERLHIEFAKRGWRASNKRDAMPQMINWLDRQEKVIRWERYFELMTPPAADDDDEERVHEKAPGEPCESGISIAKHPAKRSQPVDDVSHLHHAPGFASSLKKYLGVIHRPPRTTAQSLKHPLPFQKLDIFHQFSFHACSVDDEDDESQTVKASPDHAQFDTVLVLTGDSGESASVKGTRVGRLRVIFRLPRSVEAFHVQQAAPEYWSKEPLAYVEWFTAFRQAPDGPHGFYAVDREHRGRDGMPQGAIVPLTSIRQLCMLIPRYGDLGDSVSQTLWTSSNVLDLCDRFFLNNWQSLYTYKTLW